MLLRVINIATRPETSQGSEGGQRTVNPRSQFLPLTFGAIRIVCGDFEHLPEAVVR